MMSQPPSELSKTPSRTSQRIYAYIHTSEGGVSPLLHPSPNSITMSTNKELDPYTAKAEAENSKLSLQEKI